MNVLKSFVHLFPGGEDLTRRISMYRRGRKLERIGNTEDRFTYIFEHNKWKDPESRSGEGSTASWTENIRHEIPRLLEGFGVERMLDAPCGDYHWFRLIERDTVHYVGGDIVKSLVESNQRDHGDALTNFTHLDITQDELPDADLWMCRDCFIHLSYELIDRALANFKRSNIRYLLASTHPDATENIDIPTGHARYLNLLLPPFDFPEPLTIIDDTAHGEGRKQLALWDRAQLFE